MGLLHLIKQHDCVRALPNLLGQLSTGLKPYVAGRCADQAIHRVILLILTHVQHDHGVLRTKHEFGQRFCQFRLAHACRPKE